MLGIDSVVVFAVGGNRTGTGRKADNGAFWSVYFGEAPAGTPETARQRIVPAGIQNHDLQIIFAFHRAQYLSDIDRFITDIGLPFDDRIGRD